MIMQKVQEVSEVWFPTFETSFTFYNMMFAAFETYFLSLYLICTPPLKTFTGKGFNVFIGK